MAKVINFEEAKIKRRRFDPTEGEVLSEEEFEGLRVIISETITSLVECADKHNIDRNDFVRYAALLFKTTADISSFYQFGEGERQDGEEY